MKEAEVKALLTQWNLKWEDFMKWMIGQTLSSDADGNTIYYNHDVRQFIRKEYTGSEDINWD